MGTRLSKEHIKIVGWPSSSPVQGSFCLPGCAGGARVDPARRVKRAAYRNQAGADRGGCRSPAVDSPGMRALSVRVNDVIGVAGFTTPGTRVDVLVTLNRGEVSMSRAVVSNVQVLTAGTLYDQEQSKDGKAIPSTVVTLMVTPEDAERIVLAQNSGAIMLVLRNPLDIVPTETKGVRLVSLMGAPDARRPCESRRVSLASPSRHPPWRRPRLRNRPASRSFAARSVATRSSSRMKRSSSNESQCRIRRR